MTLHATCTTLISCARMFDHLLTLTIRTNGVVTTPLDKGLIRARRLVEGGSSEIGSLTATINGVVTTPLDKRAYPSVFIGGE